MVTLVWPSLNCCSCPGNSCILFPLFFRPTGPSKALKLGAKGKEVDNFVDKLKSEGENIMTSSVGKRSTEAAKVAPPINVER